MPEWAAAHMSVLALPRSLPRSASRDTAQVRPTPRPSQARARLGCQRRLPGSCSTRSPAARCLGLVLGAALMVLARVHQTSLCPVLCQGGERAAGSAAPARLYARRRPARRPSGAQPGPWLGPGVRVCPRGAVAAGTSAPGRQAPRWGARSGCGGCGRDTAQGAWQCPLWSWGCVPRSGCVAPQSRCHLRPWLAPGAAGFPRWPRGTEGAPGSAAKPHGASPSPRPASSSWQLFRAGVTRWPCNTAGAGERSAARGPSRHRLWSGGQVVRCAREPPWPRRGAAGATGWVGVALGRSRWVPAPVRQVCGGEGSWRGRGYRCSGAAGLGRASCSMTSSSFCHVGRRLPQGPA